MLQPSRLLICVLLAMGALVVSATAASASGHPHQAAAPVSGAAATGCDVPGAACDPSKTDHDNGIGNNCDPGYGRGNQVKFAPDEKTTGCRTTGAMKLMKPTEKEGTVESSTTVSGGVSNESTTTTTGTGTGAAGASAAGGVLAEVATLPSAHGAVLAATGLDGSELLFGLALVAAAGMIFLAKRRAGTVA